MSQVFHVVRCSRCQTFQVHQVKKVSRWSCRLCGEKQSLLKEFGRGFAADCRRHVQKLNAERGAALDKHNPSPWEKLEEEQEQVKQTKAQATQSQVSHWSRYQHSPVLHLEDAAVEGCGQRKGTSNSCTLRTFAADCVEAEVRQSSPSGKTLMAGGLAPPLPQTCSLLPVSSMFDSGDDFGYDL